VRFCARVLDPSLVATAPCAVVRVARPGRLVGGEGLGGLHVGNAFGAYVRLVGRVVLREPGVDAAPVGTRKGCGHAAFRLDVAGPARGR
jgi:hypothetical protein